MLAGSSKQQAERDRTRGYGQPGQQQGLAGAAGGYEQQAQQVPMHPVQQQQMGGYPPQQQPQGDYGSVHDVVEKMGLWATSRGWSRILTP